MVMNTAVVVEPIRGISPSLMARMAGGLYVFSLLAALSLELFLGGRLGHAANSIQMTGMVIVTLILYAIFKPVNRSLSLLAGAFNLAGITLEAIRLTPHGADIAMVFHGIFCILTGYLIYRSTFLPRVLGLLIAFGGLSWLTYLSPPLESYLSPYNLACGLIGEASVFLWLLAMGVNPKLWTAQNATAGKRLRPSKHPSEQIQSAR
jgi:hypothetical protein